MAASKKTPRNSRAILKQMPEALTKDRRHSSVNGSSKDRGADGLTPRHRILALVYAHTGYDFSFYKPNTLIPRIKRRMGIRHIAAIENYVQCLREAPLKITELVGNLLIYLQPELQEEVVALFHFAPKPNRYLMLGKSESIGQHQNLFDG